MRRSGVAFWMCAALVLFGFVMPLLPDFRSNGRVYYLPGMAFWTGLLFSFGWKKTGRSGWAGFGVGLLVGLAGGFLVGMLRGMMGTR